MYKRRLQLEITGETARALPIILGMLGEHPKRCYCCVPRASPLTLMNLVKAVRQTHGSHEHHGGQLVSSAINTSSSAAQRYTPTPASSNRAAILGANIHLKVQKSKAQAHTQTSSEQGPTVSSAENASQQDWSSVLFAVQGSRWSVELEPIAMTAVTSDSDFFCRLRTHHRTYRPALLRWASPFRFKNCRGVKVW
jgi:hypothetical protein